MNQLPDCSGRRRWLGFSGALLAGWALPARASAAVRPLRREQALMGTVVRIAAVGEAPLLAPAIDAAFAEMARLAAMMSHYAPTSAVGAINLAAGLRPIPVPPELMRVLRQAREVSQRSAGAFDITVGSVGRWHFDPAAPAMPSPAHIASHLPAVDWRQLHLDDRAGTAGLARRGMRLDTGGIAKLPILQAGLMTLKERGIGTALIDGGGDVLAITAPGTRPWRVGVRDALVPQRLAGVVEVTNGIVASSGDYERSFMRDGRRYHHVLDPRTGYPAQGAHGVTLLADGVESVNGLGTAVMVMPAAAGRALLTRSGVEALVAGRDRQPWVSRGFERRLASA